MKKKMNNHLILLLAATLLASCDGFGIAYPDVNPEVDDVASVPVINGGIRYDEKEKQGSPAWVQISYTEDINAPATTPQRFENNAVVTLSLDDGRSEVLKLVTSSSGDAGVGGVDGGADAAWPDAGVVDQGSAPDSVAAPDSAVTPDMGKGKPDVGAKGTVKPNQGYYLGSTILGEEGKTYTLSVKIGGDTYTATCEMFKAPGLAYLVINGMRSDGTFDSSSATAQGNEDAKKGSSGYSEEYYILDNKDTRDRYLTERYDNGVHNVRNDYPIDDGRALSRNTDKGWTIFQAWDWTGPSANQHLSLRIGEIDKPTHDYFNMYNRIVRGLVGVGGVTPYNPKSSFVNVDSKRTVGNFRAVSYSYIAAPIPPSPCTTVSNGAVTLKFAASPKGLDGQDLFTKYYLYSRSQPGVNHQDTRSADIKPALTRDGSRMVYTVPSPPSGTTYYRLQAEDQDGYVSALSPEVSADPGTAVDNCGSSSGNSGPMTCGSETKQCDEIYTVAKGNYCKVGSTWYQCSGGQWVSLGGK